MFGFLDGISPWAWIGFGFLLGILELLLASAILVWPAVAAMIVGILCFVLPEWLNSGFNQTVLFVVLAGVVVIVAEFVIPSSKRRVILNDPARRHIGKVGTVVSLDGTEGIALLDGVRWHFHLKPDEEAREAADTPLEKVRVQDSSGTTLIVTPIISDQRP